MVKNLPDNEGDSIDTGLIHALGRFPREGFGNPLQYSCLGNPMARGAYYFPGLLSMSCKELDMTEQLSPHKHVRIQV